MARQSPPTSTTSRMLAACCAAVVLAGVLASSGAADAQPLPRVTPAEQKEAYLQALAAPRPVELNPSIPMLGTFDYLPYQSVPPFTSRCTDMVDRAMLYVGGTRLAWVPTIYWQSSRPDRADVTGLCYMDGDTGQTKCLPVTRELIEEFKKGLQLCMSLASDIGVNEHAVVPHLDESSRLSSAWRNAVIVSPTERYNGFTYEEALLNPIADALGSVAKPFTKIYFALQGEMSATVLRFPREYTELIERVRQRIMRAARAVGVELPPEQVKIGLSWNYNAITPGEVDAELTPEVVAAQGAIQENGGGGKGRKVLQDQTSSIHASLIEALAAAVAPTTPDERRRGEELSPPAIRPGETPGKPASAAAAAGGGGAFDAPAKVYASAERGRRLAATGGSLRGRRGPAGAPILAPPVDLRAVRRLLMACDFIGISAYASQTADFTENQLQNSIFTFYNEFKAKTNIDLAQLMQAYNIPMHYSEYGLGGGMSMDGATPALTAEQAAFKPFFGTYPAVYEPSKDPWRRPQVRAFMEAFWQKTLSWLSKGGGPTYHITACFSWTLGSYDVFAIYPESSALDGSSYLQPQVAREVKAHNTRVAERNRELDLLGVALQDAGPAAAAAVGGGP